jgi:hypothetical protein
VIRAISQRWLLKFWQQDLGAHRVPCWQAAEGEDLSRVSANLSFLDVIAGDDGLRFQIRSHGEMIGWVYGSPDCRGRFLHEDKPEPARALALAPYRQAVTTGRPIYLIQGLTDRQGRVVHNERLLLPFARDGKRRPYPGLVRIHLCGRRFRHPRPHERPGRSAGAAAVGANRAAAARLTAHVALKARSWRRRFRQALALAHALPHLIAHAGRAPAAA